MNIIIPMAGDGKRFKDAGYNIDKPFIKIKGKMMVEYVLESFKSIKGKKIYTLICKESFKELYKNELKYLLNNYNICFNFVNKKTKGAACTVLNEYIKKQKLIENEKLIIADVDTFYDNKIIKKFFDDIKVKKIDVCVTTFKSNENKFSYVKLNKKNKVIDIKEKEVISNNALTGIYYFSKGCIFFKNIMEILIYNDKIEKEYYMSNVIKNAINNNYLVENYSINKKDFNCVGTPQQLQEFINNEK